MIVVTALQTEASAIYSIATSEHGSIVSPDINVAVAILQQLGVDDPLPRIEAALESGVAEVLN